MTEKDDTTELYLRNLGYMDRKTKNPEDRTVKIVTGGRTYYVNLNEPYHVSFRDKHGKKEHIDMENIPEKDSEFISYFLEALGSEKKNS